MSHIARKIIMNVEAPDPRHAYDITYITVDAVNNVRRYNRKPYDTGVKLMFVAMAGAPLEWEEHIYYDKIREIKTLLEKNGFDDYVTGAYIISLLHIYLGDIDLGELYYIGELYTIRVYLGRYRKKDRETYIKIGEKIKQIVKEGLTRIRNIHFKNNRIAVRMTYKVRRYRYDRYEREIEIHVNIYVYPDKTIDLLSMFF
ncbi:MAG: hypothetical protein QXT13_11850 [Pyrobaculum sp.]